MVFATDFSLAHTVPYFPSHHEAWPELPVIALNVFCILLKFHQTSSICSHSVVQVGNHRYKICVSLLYATVVTLCILFYLVTSFCELAPMLIRNSARYLLSEGFSQDPVEKYFSQQRHRGGENENPTVERFQTNAAILMQRQQNRHDLKTMFFLTRHTHCGSNWWTPPQEISEALRKFIMYSC